MGDYLTNLVGKALNQEPVVQPRRAPRFAPSPYTTGAAALASFGSPGLERLPTPERPTERAIQRLWPAAESDAQAVTSEHLARPATALPSAIDRRDATSQPSGPEPTASVAGKAPADETARPHPPRTSAVEHDAGGANVRRPSPSVERRTPRSQRDPDIAPGDRNQTTAAADRTRASALSPHHPRIQRAADRSQTPHTQPALSAPMPPPQPVDLDESTARAHAEQAIHQPSKVGRQASQRQPVTTIPYRTDVSYRRESQTIGPERAEKRRYPQAAANDARLATIRVVSPPPAVEKSTESATRPAEAMPFPVQLRARRAPTPSDIEAHTVKPANEEHNEETLSSQSTPVNRAAETAIQPVSVPLPTNPLKPRQSAPWDDRLGAPGVRPIRTVEQLDAKVNETPASPQPTIHVTIGRIEVRATPSSPAQARKQSAPSVMSLHDYLHAQKGGRR